MSQAPRHEISVEVGAAPQVPGVPTINGIKIDQLSTTFEITKDVSETPNSAEVEIINLSEKSRHSLLDAAGKAGVVCRVSAGLTGEVGLLYQGVMQQVEVYRDGVDWVTQLSSDDGAEALEEDESKGKKVPAKVSLRLSRGMPMQIALQKVVEAAGLTLSASTAATPVLLARSLSPVLTYPVSLSGPAKRVLAKFANATNLNWHVQDGTFEGGLRGVPFDPAGPLLRVGGTLTSARTDASGDLTAACLLDHRIRPGTAVTVQGESVQGVYTVDSLSHNGSTSLRNSAWSTSFTGVPL